MRHRSPSNSFNPSAHIEKLEHRRLLSASMGSHQMLEYTATGDLAVPAAGFVAANIENKIVDVKLTIEGQTERFQILTFDAGTQHEYLLNLNGEIESSGAYVYAVTGDNTATITFQDQGSDTPDFTASLTFTSTGGGSITIQPPGAPAAQVGTFSFGFTTVLSRQLTVLGTAGNDVTGLTNKAGTIKVTQNGVTNNYPASSVDNISVFPLDGNDIVTYGGGIGATYTDGGAGNDAITGGAGKDTITGGAGKDVLVGGEGDDRINGSGSPDALSGGLGNDRLYGGDGDDVLSGQSNVDRLFGGDGNDYLIGGTSNDKLYGENDNDALDGGTGDDLLDGGIGDDKMAGGDGADALTGAAGKDVLDGGPGVDTLNGNGQDDKILARDSAADIVDAGAGNDSAQSDAIDQLTSVETTIP